MTKKKKKAIIKINKYIYIWNLKIYIVQNRKNYVWKTILFAKNKIKKIIHIYIYIFCIMVLPCLSIFNKAKDERVIYSAVSVLTMSP